MDIHAEQVIEKQGRAMQRGGVWPSSGALGEGDDDGVGLSQAVAVRYRHRYRHRHNRLQLAGPASATPPFCGGRAKRQ